MSSRTGSRPPEAQLTGWPADALPAEAAVFTHDERVVPAAPEQVWTWLVRAGDWPEWYGNAERVLLPAGVDRLEAGTRFTWTTFRVRLVSEVVVWEAPTAIGWRWWRRGAWGYHGWGLQEHPAGCRVVTEESQCGPLPRLAPRLLSWALHAAHDLWHRQLADRAVHGHR